MAVILRKRQDRKSLLSGVPPAVSHRRDHTFWDRDFSASKGFLLGAGPSRRGAVAVAEISGTLPDGFTDGSFSRGDCIIVGEGEIFHQVKGTDAFFLKNSLLPGENTAAKQRLAGPQTGKKPVDRYGIRKGCLIEKGAVSAKGNGTDDARRKAAGLF